MHNVGGVRLKLVERGISRQKKGWGTSVSILKNNNFWNGLYQDPRVYVICGKNQLIIFNDVDLSKGKVDFRRRIRSVSVGIILGL